MRKQLTLPIALVLLVASCDKAWPSTGISNSREGLVVAVANCGGDSVKSVRIEDDEGRVLWEVSADPPREVFFLDSDSPPDEFLEVVPLDLGSLQATQLVSVFVELTNSNQSGVTTRDSYPLKRLRTGDLYVHNGRYVPVAEYQEWADENVCSNWSGLVALAREHPGTAAGIGGSALLVAAVASAAFRWKRSRTQPYQP